MCRRDVRGMPNYVARRLVDVDGASTISSATARGGGIFSRTKCTSRICGELSRACSIPCCSSLLVRAELLESSGDYYAYERPIKRLVGADRSGKRARGAKIIGKLLIKKIVMLILLSSGA